MATAEDIIGHLLRLSIIVKLFHLRTKSLSLHLASEELYKSIIEKTDTISEVHQGYTGELLSIKVKEAQGFDDILPIVTKSREYIIANKSVFEIDNQSHLDDLLSSMSLFLYKAKFLK